MHVAKITRRHKEREYNSYLARRSIRPFGVAGFLQPPSRLGRSLLRGSECRCQTAGVIVGGRKRRRSALDSRDCLAVITSCEGSACRVQL